MILSIFDNFFSISLLQKNGMLLKLANKFVSISKEIGTSGGSGFFFSSTTTGGGGGGVGAGVGVGGGVGGGVGAGVRGTKRTILPLGSKRTILPLGSTAKGIG